MLFDLLVTNARLPDSSRETNILCANGKIADIGPGVSAPAAATIDARGYLVSPPFIDSHFHMDATLSLGIPRLNRPARCSRA